MLNSGSAPSVNALTCKSSLLFGLTPSNITTEIREGGIIKSWSTDQGTERHFLGVSTEGRYRRHLTLWPPSTEPPLEILVFERLPFRRLRLIAREHPYEGPLEIATETGPDLSPEFI